MINTLPGMYRYLGRSPIDTSNWNCSKYQTTTMYHFRLVPHILQVFEHCASKFLHVVSGGQRDCYLKVWKQCLLDILPLSLDPINLLTPPPPLPSHPPFPILPPSLPYPPPPPCSLLRTDPYNNKYSAKKGSKTYWLFFSNMHWSKVQLKSKLCIFL